MIDEVEEECLRQLYNMVNHVAFDGSVRIMPDCHSGKGAVIGFCMPLKQKVVPSVVGCDLGCGVLSVNIGGKINFTYEKLDELIRENIPTGFNTHETHCRPGKMENFSFSKHFPWDEVNKNLNNFFYSYNKAFGTSYIVPFIDYRSFVERFGKIADIKNVANACGTLGGGNHMYEIGQSKNTGDFWISIHSGSRNFGKVVYEHHEKIAKSKLSVKRNEILRDKIEEITKTTEDRAQISNLIKKAKQELGLDSDVDLKGMEYLEGEDLKEYLIDMVIAQAYASFNRRHMMDITREILGGIKGGECIESVHNYIDFKDFMIRKGAIRSYIGEKMVIPFNMRDGILICEGKSNPDWNYSCCHGSGRKMSRSQAKATLDMDTFRHQMEGIYSTSILPSVLDEAPNSYKNSKMIEEAIQPTATIIDKLIPVLNIKDKNSGPSWKERREEKKKAVARKEERKFKQDNF